MWIVVWVVVGGLAGLLASLLIRGTGLGLVEDILIGIVGAALGGFLANQFGHAGVTGLNLYSLVVAFVGAEILLLIIRLGTPSRLMILRACAGRMVHR
jgi:uncharacterized membrane protein YeaQ/YmgE (transglycosylase-associated protein family)